MLADLDNELKMGSGKGGQHHELTFKRYVEGRRVYINKASHIVS